MTRTDVLNHLAEKYQLKRYLEIGVQVPELNFDKIICPYKVGVDSDPNAKADIVMTSDDFFKIAINEKWLTNPPKPILDKFHLIFIDGSHLAEQVKKDFENALKILSPNGFIVLHDVNPETSERTLVPRLTKTGTWNGSVYKFAIQLPVSKGLKVYTVDEDHGVMVVQRTEEEYILCDYTFNAQSWDYFDANRKELLNLISFDEFIKL